MRWSLDSAIFRSNSRFSVQLRNSGYFLLGVLLEKVTGQSYEQVLSNQIFTPLGMGDSGYGRPQILPGRASGYSRQGSK